MVFKTVRRIPLRIQAILSRGSLAVINTINIVATQLFFFFWTICTWGTGLLVLFAAIGYFRYPSDFKDILFEGVNHADNLVQEKYKVASDSFCD